MFVTRKIILGLVMISALTADALQKPEGASSQKEKPMFTGLQTVMCHVDHMERAKQ